MASQDVESREKDSDKAPQNKKHRYIDHFKNFFALPLGKVVSGMIIIVLGTVIAGLFLMPPDFGVSVDPMDGTIEAGGVKEATVTVDAKWRYPKIVSLDSGGEPSGVVISFTQSSLRPSFLRSYISSASISVDSSVPAGKYKINIIGEGAEGTTHTCCYTLTVLRPPTSTPTPTLTPTTSPDEESTLPPTLTPTTSPDEESTPTPTPLTVEINHPHGETTHWTTVEGTVSRALEDGEYMWLIVNSWSNLHDWWPQTGGPIIPSGVNWDGFARVGGGGKDLGKEFKIAVVVVNDELNDEFTDWVSECEQQQEWPAITEERISHGVIEASIVDQVTVVLTEMSTVSIDAPSSVKGGEDLIVEVRWGNFPANWKLTVSLEESETDYTRLADDVSKIIKGSGEDKFTLKVYPATEVHDHAKICACFYRIYKEKESLIICEKNNIEVYSKEVSISDYSPTPVHGGEELTVEVFWWNIPAEWELKVSLEESETDDTRLADDVSKIIKGSGEDKFTLKVYPTTEVHNQAKVCACLYEGGEWLNLYEKKDIEVLP